MDHINASFVKRSSCYFATGKNFMLQTLLLLFIAFLYAGSATAQNNVGIGVSNPAEKLQVEGNIKASGKAITTGYTYPAPTSYFYVVSAGDLQPYSDDILVRRTLTGGAAAGVGNGNSGLIAALHLPHGASVKEVKVYYFDDSNVANFNVAVTSTGSVVLTALGSNGNAGDGVLTSDVIRSPIIDNINSYYHLLVKTFTPSWPTNNIYFKRAVIEYTITSL